MTVDMQQSIQTIRLRSCSYVVRSSNIIFITNNKTFEQKSELLSLLEFGNYADIPS